MIKDLQSSAAALYDGGWRASDKDQLIKEYSLTQGEADDICAELEKMEKVVFEINGIEYTFKMDSVDGTEVLTATYTQNGESHTIWTVEATSLPESEEEAADYISDFDWAVEQSTRLISRVSRSGGLMRQRLSQAQPQIK